MHVRYESAAETEKDRKSVGHLRMQNGDQTDARCSGKGASCELLRSEPMSRLWRTEGLLRWRIEKKYGYKRKPVTAIDERAGQKRKGFALEASSPRQTDSQYLSKTRERWTGKSRFPRGIEAVRVPHHYLSRRQFGQGASIKRKGRV